MAKSAKPVDARHYDVIVAPHITEKSTLASEYNAIVFKVANDATKSQIKEAVEAIYDRKVAKVNTIVVKGKTKRFGRFEGRRGNVRKAYVSLKPGQEINFAQEVK